MPESFVLADLLADIETTKSDYQHGTISKGGACQSFGVIRRWTNEAFQAGELSDSDAGVVISALLTAGVECGL
jgi:hypothetical protein